MKQTLLLCLTLVCALGAAITMSAINTTQAMAVAGGQTVITTINHNAPGVLPPPGQDADNNGLSDLWEMQHFGQSGIDPNDDADGDGLKNWQEFQAETDPLKPHPGWVFFALPADLIPVIASPDGIALLRDETHYWRWHEGVLTMLAEYNYPYDNDDIATTAVMNRHGDVAIKTEEYRAEPASNFADCTYIAVDTLGVYPINRGPVWTYSPPVFTSVSDFTDSWVGDRYALDTERYNVFDQMALAEDGALWGMQISGIYVIDETDTEYWGLLPHYEYFRFELARVPAGGGAAVKYHDDVKSFSGLDDSGRPVGLKYAAYPDALTEGFVGQTVVPFSPIAQSSAGRVISYDNGIYVLHEPDGTDRSLPSFYVYSFDGQERLSGRSSSDPYLLTPTGIDGAWRQIPYVNLPMPTGWVSNHKIAVGSESAQLGQVSINGGPQQPFIAIPTPAKLAVDANRDGEIKFSDENPSDQTSTDKPFRFWVNDDDDVDDDPEDSENAPVSTADYTDDKIDGIRDLEDFSRLKIYLGGLQDAVRQGQIRVGLKWKGASGSTGAAGIKVWRNLSPNGGTEYLTNVNVAQQHLALRGPGTIQGALSYIIPTQYWTDVGLSESQPYGNLLFECISAGKDQLVITLHKADGTEIGEGPGVSFDLKNIKSMYERMKATADGVENFPFPYNHVGSDPVPAPAMGWTPDPNGFPFEPAPGESATYIVSVHGWNQTYERSTMYAETMFKRMWHRGYKGRFVRFRWPTFTGLTTYNDSEYRAWKCGVSLKQYLDTLPGTYTVNLVAHSMGNIVAGSALEKGAAVANYALLNAAVPAICYDTSGNVVQTSWGYVTPNDDPDSATVALSYQSRLANVSGNLVNFFLPADSALSAWELNNDSPSGGRFPLVGTKPHQWPEGSLETAGYRYQRTATAGQKLRVVRVAGERILASPDEAMGFAVQAPSLTVGADGRTRGAIDDWADMTAYGFDSVHSAEFLFTIHQTRDFYGTLLLKLGVAVQP